MKTLIAMSGGVDSSVAAFLAKQMGYDCVGCTMKLYADAQTGNGRTCCALEDVEDARSVAHRLGMRYYVFNFQDTFQEKVIDKFIKSYENGITPNPCIDCNRYMKFEKLFERADILECSHIVTGHYARICLEGDRYILKKALDEEKDQSYVLYSMTQSQLARTLFPLGNMTKREVRQIAGENGFCNANKPDSQDICFVPEGDYAAVIRQYTGSEPPSGEFVDTQGNVLCRHKGIHHYTIGQRRGLGVSLPQSRYVVRICSENHQVVLGDENDLLERDFRAGDVNWIAGEPPAEIFRCNVRIRYRQPEQPALVRILKDGRVWVTFDTPQRAIAPGQAAVFYDGQTVLGGGVIEKKEWV